MTKKDKMTAEIIGDSVCLKRKQWGGHEARISNYPGLLEKVEKYTWTYSKGEHPYLRSSKLNISLHKFVLSYLYGEDKIETMLEQNNIIEHLDNDGLNCCYDNLHILSSDLNKAKAFTIDKSPEITGIPIFITDVYYSHKNKRYQMQVFFNKDIWFTIPDNQAVEQFIMLYDTFENLFIDWLYITQSRADGFFDISKFHSTKILVQPRPVLYLSEEEMNQAIIVRDGKYYIRLETDDPYRLAFMTHTAFQDINE